MADLIDITGQKFNYLTAVRKSEFRGSGEEGKVHWECRCECGKLTVTRGDALRRGIAISCGCKSKTIKHGKSRSKEYRTWQAIKKRVYDTELPQRKYYLDKGIDIDPRWEASFEAFYEDMGTAPSPKHSIDRRDGSLGYWKFNCRWATPTEQSRNLSSNRLITYKKKTQCVAAWEEELGVSNGQLSQKLRQGWNEEVLLANPSLINRPRGHEVTYKEKTQCVAAWEEELGFKCGQLIQRLADGWDIERAFTEPIHQRQTKGVREITYNGKTQSVTAWAKELGIERRIIYKRLNYGWDVEKALTTPRQDPMDNLNWRNC